MAKKNKAKKPQHKSFRITPPKPTYNMIFFYMFISLFVGVMLGILLGNQTLVVLATYTP